ncbi:hypothetical protein BDB00DRAFT_817623, partial [Zychaea mexicana]|uniref:uncharacterized protein n=1 Tax=Zychaea mexicana TaxID=64656 RepID=UPI0022FE1EFE
MEINKGSLLLLLLVVLIMYSNTRLTCCCVDRGLITPRTSVKCCLQMTASCQNCQTRIQHHLQKPRRNRIGGSKSADSKSKRTVAHRIDNDKTALL